QKRTSHEESLDVIRREIIDSSAEREVLKSKRDMLIELVEKSDGFLKSVKAIIEKTRPTDSPIKAYPLADIVRIESGFEQAVESSLGELTNAVIVRTRQDAESLILFLRNENAGRANFYITEDAASLTDTGHDAPEGAQPMSRLISSEAEYQNIVAHIFRDIYLVGSASDADRLFREHSGCTFVTKSGYVRRGARVFDGAAIEAEMSVLGRREKIADMNASLERISLKLDELLVREKNEIAALDECKSSLGAKEDRYREEELTLANIESERQALMNDLKKVDDEKTVLDTEICEEETTVSELTARGETMNTELCRLEEERAGLEGKVTSLEAAIREKSSERELTQLRIADLKGELAGIQLSYDNISSNLVMRREECSEIEKDLEQNASRSGGAAARVGELEDEIVQLEADRQALSETQEHLEALNAELAAKKDQETLGYSEKERILHESQAEMETLRNSIRDLEVKISEIGYKRSTVIERVQQAYKEDLTTLSVQVDEATNWDEAKETIAALKEKLDRMGPVNLVAIEEHKELEERFLFLTKQKDDLVQAKDSLHKAIIKINATTRKLFIETFEKVQVEFRDYFKMLFGGGQAEIFLIDEHDVLESGIEIVVRPPGKKLQNILLLSGGEKALTAIALLFAIFKVNPSPFCILDEIDAPLDELNIDRFARVLREFLKISQFIIITHNKKTIQMADVLYGITMAERGVSKIVSVKFSDGAKTEEDKTEEVMV
ncbi:MAG: hypothetical protein PHT32_08445, partial [Candidatus Omnitrophica bacterium]|nr:hypothetical protein [Candidatus Omnitrophota bacterium]